MLEFPFLLGNNNIKQIPPDIFSSLTKLKQLQLFKNKLAVIPSEISLLQGTSRNIVNHMYIFSSLKLTKTNLLSDIEVLTLSSNNLKKLPRA